MCQNKTMEINASLVSGHVRCLLVMALAGLLTLAVNPVAALQSTGFDEACLLEALKNGPADRTLGEIRAECHQADTDSAKKAQPVEAGDNRSGRASRRMTLERATAARPFSILAHEPNYFLVAAYNTKGWDPTLYRAATSNPGYQNDDIEAQFQISLKVPLALDLFSGHMDIYGGYTNRSFWQMYNHQYSEPFRETNHAPELWLQFANDWQVAGLTNIVNTIGWMHQSNGRGGQLSRSWDRLYATFVFEKENFALSIKPWIWLTQDKAKSDNPDITDYLGHGELRGVWHYEGNVFSVMLRNQLESGFERGAAELSWSFPVFGYPYLKGYLQYFRGYGESLIDYNRKVNRLGLGISITDWID